MKVFVAAVSSEKQYAKGMMSFNSLAVRDGDKKLIKLGTRGDMARMTMGEKFLESDFDAILLLDLDMVHPPDLLERLRAHDVDMVSGHYFRRHVNPMRSVVSLISPDNKWPYLPLITIPDDGLHEIACTGFGCALIKRHVVEAVIEMLPLGSPPFSLGPMPEEANNENGPFGSDFNFFMRARRIGYNLWLDASLESEHACTIWLNREIYKQMGGETGDSFWKPFWRHTMKFNGVNEVVIKARLEVLRENMEKLESRLRDIDVEKNGLLKTIMVVGGQISENEIYLNEFETIGRGDMYKIGNVPVFETQAELDKALQNRGQGYEGKTHEETKDMREKSQKKHAKDILDEVAGREETS